MFTNGDTLRGQKGRISGIDDFFSRKGIPTLYVTRLELGSSSSKRSSGSWSNGRSSIKSSSSSNNSGAGGSSGYPADVSFPPSPTTLVSSSSSNNNGTERAAKRRRCDDSDYPKENSDYMEIDLPHEICLPVSSRKTDQEFAPFRENAETYFFMLHGRIRQLEHRLDKQAYFNLRSQLQYIETQYHSTKTIAEDFAKAAKTLHHELDEFEGRDSNLDKRVPLPSALYQLKTDLSRERDLNWIKIM